MYSSPFSLISQFCLASRQHFHTHYPCSLRSQAGLPTKTYQLCKFWCVVPASATTANGVGVTLCPQALISAQSVPTLKMLIAEFKSRWQTKLQTGQTNCLQLKGMSIIVPHFTHFSMYKSCVFIFHQRIENLALSYAHTYLHL